MNGNAHATTDPTVRRTAHLVPLGRWRPAARRDPHGPALGAWAAALAGRYRSARSAPAGGGAGVLATRRPSLLVQRVAGPRIDVRLQPTLRVSIAAYLRQGFWRRSADGAAAPRPAFALPPHTAADRSTRRATDDLAGNRADDRAAGIAEAATRAPLLPLAPLDLVLRRLRAMGGDGDAELASPLAVPLAIQHRARLARDLAAGRERREAAGGEARPALAARPARAAAAPAVAEPPEWPQRKERERPAPWDVEGPSRTAVRDLPATAPAVFAAPNVDQIAEQVLHRIDRRLGAWRERTGAF
jgi:hypothetical protein